MADNPNSAEDLSSYQRTVVLRDWWLIKCSVEFEGKRFGVAGTQVAETGSVRAFTSSPIIKAFDVFTLEASDGVCIILRGFLNKQRVVQSGFSPEISREFIFGFPPCWESKCNRCFAGVIPSGAPLISNNASSPTIISPCNTTKWNIPAVVEKKNTDETNDKNSRVGGSTSRDDKPARKKSLRLQSKSIELMSRVKNRTPNHGGEGLSKAKSGGGVTKDECEVINNEVISPAAKKHTGADTVDKVTRMSATEESQGKCELEATKACQQKSGKPGKNAVAEKSGRILRSDGNVEHVNYSETKVKRKLDVVSEVQKSPTSTDVGHGSEGLYKDKGNGVERDECMVNEKVSPVGAANSKKITSKKGTKESLTSEQRKGKLKVVKTSLSDSSSKHRENGKSKKSEKILKGDLDEVSVEPMTHSRSKVKDNLSVEKTIRKIDFDEEVTPEKDVKKQKSNAVLSADSLGQKRSRSGRVLVSPLEFWRNQVPVYDLDRNLVQVKERYQTNSTPPSTGKGSVSRKPRR